MKKIAFVGGCVLAGLLAAAPAFSADALRDTGTCKLVNTDADKVIYDGDCRIKQENLESSGVRSTRYTIKLGSAEPFLFACPKSTPTKCQHGPEDTKLQQHGSKATFKWGDFKLVVNPD
jgi:hypothetical protein